MFIAWYLWSPARVETGNRIVRLAARRTILFQRSFVLTLDFDWFANSAVSRIVVVWILQFFSRRVVLNIVLVNNIGLSSVFGNFESWLYLAPDLNRQWHKEPLYCHVAFHCSALYCIVHYSVVFIILHCAAFVHQRVYYGVYRSTFFVICLYNYNTGNHARFLNKIRGYYSVNKNWYHSSYQRALKNYHEFPFWIASAELFNRTVSNMQFVLCLSCFTIYWYWQCTNGFFGKGLG